MTDTREVNLREGHPPEPVTRRLEKWTVTRSPRMLVSALAVLLAVLLNKVLPVIPSLTSTVILGIISANVPRLSAQTSQRLRPGLTLVSKRFMRAGIVLLGLKLSIVDIFALGKLLN